jgi:hypothetical protein
MSLSEVPAEETQELPTSFYQHRPVEEKSKHEALQEGQVDEREVVEQRYGSDLPY